MSTFLVIALSMAAAYLLGSIPTSFIVARRMTGLDIRTQGSGNAGATNVLRVAGKLPALGVLIADIAKGVIAVTVLANFAAQASEGTGRELLQVLLGFSVIAGHIWSVFLKFKGGKGVATTIGVLAVIAPLAFFPSILVWLIFFSIYHYVSLASIVFGVALPIFALIFGAQLPMILFTVTLCILNSYKHKKNIIRLIRGEEPKTYILKKL